MSKSKLWIHIAMDFIEWNFSFIIKGPIVKFISSAFILNLSYLERMWGLVGTNQTSGNRE